MVHMLQSFQIINYVFLSAEAMSNCRPLNGKQIFFFLLSTFDSIPSIQKLQSTLKTCAVDCKSAGCQISPCADEMTGCQIQHIKKGEKSTLGSAVFSV